jgi:hypothetical protein
MPNLAPQTGDGDFCFVPADEPEAAVAKIAELARVRIPSFRTRRLAYALRLTVNLFVLVSPQWCMKPRKSNVSLPGGGSVAGGEPPELDRPGLAPRRQGGPNSAKWRRATVAPPPPPLSRARLASRLGEREGHVALAVGGLHAHEHGLLALALGVWQTLALRPQASRPACLRRRE